MNTLGRILTNEVEKCNIAIDVHNVVPAAGIIDRKAKKLVV